MLFRKMSFLFVVLLAVIGLFFIISSVNAEEASGLNSAEDIQNMSNEEFAQKVFVRCAKIGWSAGVQDIPEKFAQRKMKNFIEKLTGNDFRDRNIIIILLCKTAVEDAYDKGKAGWEFDRVREYIRENVASLKINR